MPHVVLARCGGRHRRLCGTSSLLFLVLVVAVESVWRQERWKDRRQSVLCFHLETAKTQVNTTVIYRHHRIHFKMWVDNW